MEDLDMLNENPQLFLPHMHDNQHYSDVETAIPIDVRSGKDGSPLVICFGNINEDLPQHSPEINEVKNIIPRSSNETAKPMIYIKVPIYDNISDSETDVVKCTICKNNYDIKDFNLPKDNSVSHIVSYIKYILSEVYGPDFKEQISSIEYKFVDEFQRNSFLELFIKKSPNKSVPKKEIIHTQICKVPNTRRKVKTNKQKISCFFPKLLTKIASKSDILVKKTLISKESLFILSCTAKLAWKLNNIDAFALFKLSAVEIERGNLKKAIVYYKQARISLSEMIFHDKIFSFLFNGKTELTIVKELPHNDVKYFLYRQTNTALLNDNSIFSFTFDETDHIKLNNTEIDGVEAIKSIDYLSLEDLEKVASKFTSNSDERTMNGKNSGDLFTNTAGCSTAVPS